MESNLVYILYIVGFVLVALELVVPGMVSIFFGISLLLVTLFYQNGWIDSFAHLIMAWLALSFVMIFTLRELFAKLLPGDRKKEADTEDLDGIGAIVPVLRDISDQHSKGRIEYQGTSWSATSSLSNGRIIKSGERVKLIKRQLNTWTVEPLDDTQQHEP